MFRSAVFKLTAWYVGALLTVCIVFSIPIYTIVSSQLRSGALQQTELFRQLPSPLEELYVSQLEKLRDRQLARDRRQLLWSLIVLNGGIVGIGAYGSYLFAKRTLRPIEEVHAAQVRFTSDASHELRTPLAVMQTEIEVALRNKAITSNEAKEVLNSNLEEVARLRQLSDQLLSLTRIGDRSLSLSRLNLAKMIRGEIQSLSKRHKIPITIAGPKDAWVLADKVLLAQVLDIIVDNAVTYSGRKDPEISVSLRSKSKQWLVSVTNQGEVIAPKDLQRIFDRFYRGIQAPSQNAGGHGLGLSLAQEIITAHQGTISASSSRRRGTTFTISLPRDLDNQTKKRG